MASEGTPGRFFELGEDDPVAVAGYRLTARLGSGGMGKVYLSYTPGGRPVAIKVIRPEFSEDPEFRRRFQHEVQAAQRVQGLYTAPVIDCDTEGRAPWLATAYVPGPALGSAVAEHGPMPVHTVLLLVAGIAEALQVIHGAGIVHRDLKPSNVLLASDGPRVIDFGIARAADSTALTSSGVAIGTPSFMSPEQAAGEAVTEATDIFALGQVAAYAALGTPAFGEGPSHAVLYRIVHDEPSLDELPEELRALVSGCLAKDPAARPSVSEVIGMCQEASGATQLVRPEDWLPDTVAADIASRAAAPAPAETTDPSPRTPPPPTAPMTEVDPRKGIGPKPAAGGSPQGPPTPPPPQPPTPPQGMAAAPTMAGGPGHQGGHPGPYAAPYPPGPGPRYGAPMPPPGPHPRPYVQPKRNRGKIIAVVFGGVVVFWWGILGIGALVDGDGDGESSSSRSSESQDGKPEKRPDPKPAKYRNINLTTGYTLHFADDPLKPKDADDMDDEFKYYSDDMGGDREFSSPFDAGKLVLLNNAQKGSLKTCRDETRFTDTIPLDRVSKGSQICVQTASGHIALVTYKGQAPESDPSDYVSLDVTVWRNAIEPQEEDGL